MLGISRDEGTLSRMPCMLHTYVKKRKCERERETVDPSLEKAHVREVG